MSEYDDIINLPHYVSATRVPMPMENRAAQFAPFAALSGHDDAIEETARLTCEKPELSAEELTRLSRRLRYAVERNVEVRVTYFQPDEFKQGGSYRVITSKIKRIEEINGLLLFQDMRSVVLENIINIEGQGFDDMEL